MKPIDILTGGQHSRNIKANVCTTCGGEAKEFDDDLSKREHEISGLCQKCQDLTFGPNPEDLECRVNEKMRDLGTELFRLGQCGLDDPTERDRDLYESECER